MTKAMALSHSFEQRVQIDLILRAHSIKNYRFCIENDCYICDELGNFYSICHKQRSKSGNEITRYRMRKLKGSTDKYGYITYRIALDGIKKHLKGHRMMLNAWVGEQPEMSVNHLDGDKKNNNLSNLEWCTVAENNAHAIKTGLFNPYSIKQTYKIPLHEWIPIYILHKHCGYSLSRLGRMHKCAHDTIKGVVARIGRVLPKEVSNEYCKAV